MRKFKLSIVLALTALLLLAVPVSAACTFQELIVLPEGFQPEGIAVGRGSTFFTGSLADGQILRGDLRSGEYDTLVEGQEGMVSVGMAYSSAGDLLFVAGGGTGLARVFDASTGELLESYQLADPGSGFINDVIVTREAAYFTNSFADEFYVLPLGPGGVLPGPDEFETITLGGDWQQVSNFNANGIEASRSGEWLIIVHSALGQLFRVDPETGEALAIDLGGQSVSNGDGLLLRGSLLYVVRNQLNQIAVVDLDNDLTSGEVVDTLVSDDFAVPTTAAAFGNAIYAVNAKFGAPDPTGIPYEVVRVPLN